MYVYSQDKAITYTPEDLILFRESPFACWMERLTLENPGHGIAPDVDGKPPGDSPGQLDELADTLRAQSKDIIMIDGDMDEPGRRKATLDAMRRGTDFIVNGQLALGPLSGVAHLLARTSGYSELGDFLYAPCDALPTTVPQSAFGLCFLADLLSSLQGQLPPQMLVIHRGEDLELLQTERHIYCYRAVKARFVRTMRDFRKHRMPDPAESSHFGRWSDCAHEVLKRRLLQEEAQGDEPALEAYVETLNTAVGIAGGGTTRYDLGNIRPAAGQGSGPHVVAISQAGAEASGPLPGGSPANLTLVEQARMLKPGAYKPGPGVYRLGPPRAAAQSRREAAVSGSGRAPVSEQNPAPVTAPPANPCEESPVPPVGQKAGTDGAMEPHQALDKPRYNRRVADALGENLEHVGLEPQARDTDPDTSPAAKIPLNPGAAPSPSLRDPRGRGPSWASSAVQVPPPALGGGAVWGSSTGASIDMDGTHIPIPPHPAAVSSQPAADHPVRGRENLDETDPAIVDKPDPFASHSSSDSVLSDRGLVEAAPEQKFFSNSLITCEDVEN